MPLRQMISNSIILCYINQSFFVFQGGSVTAADQQLRIKYLIEQLMEQRIWKYTSIRREELSGPVAGTAGNLLPGLLVQLIDIFVYAENLAAVHAAQSYSPSADLEFYFPAAGLALHVHAVL